MKINRINIITLWLVFFQINCNDNKTTHEIDFKNVLSGEYAKLWIFKTSDSLDCHCYYEIIYKSGKMNHFLLDKKTGEFISFFNELSGDNLNSDKSWKFKSDTLNLMGKNYKLFDISEKKDTIVLESVNSFTPSRRYYLIDAKLMNPISIPK